MCENGPLYGIWDIWTDGYNFCDGWLRSESGIIFHTPYLSVAKATAEGTGKRVHIIGPNGQPLPLPEAELEPVGGERWIRPVDRMPDDRVLKLVWLKDDQGLGIGFFSNQDMHWHIQKIFHQDFKAISCVRYWRDLPPEPEP